MKKKQIIKAWIKVYTDSDIRPGILWEKPAKKDIEIHKKLDIEIRPCKIIIN